MKLPNRFLVLSIFCLVATAKTHAGDTQKVVDQLQGKWDIVAIEKRGRPEPKEEVPPLRIVIKDRVLRLDNEQADLKVNLKFHADTVPLALDLEIEKDKNVLEGICRVDGDTLTLAWCETPNLKSRPAAFTTTDESDHIVVTFKRIKE